MDNFTFLGDRVLIKLEEATTDMHKSGLVRPQYKVGETEGGRFVALLDEKPYLPKGTVIGISPTASAKLTELGTPISNGDRVYVSQRVVNPDFQFFPERETRVVDFEGYILIPYTSIEAIFHEQ